MRHCRALLLVGLALTASARAGVVDVLNEARRGECGARFAADLRGQRALDSTARLLSSGRQLREALIDAGYRADEVTALHVTEIRTQAQLRTALVERFCSTLKDKRFSEAGATRRGTEYWIVIAAPFAPPPSASAAQVERQVLSLVNEARAHPRQCGRIHFDASTPLRLDEHLHRAAQAHAAQMAAHSRLEHSGLDGSTPAQRVRSTGMALLALVGENIAGGPATAAEVVQGWLNSPGHCANIMDPRYRLMAVAFAANARSELGIYWAQEFAALEAQEP